MSTRPGEEADREEAEKALGQGGVGNWPHVFWKSQSKWGPSLRLQGSRASQASGGGGCVQATPWAEDTGRGV